MLYGGSILFLSTLILKGFRQGKPNLVMEKEWTKHSRFSKEYINDFVSFLHIAYSSIGRPQGREILYPYASCKNCYWTRRNVVFEHLIAMGFVWGYNVWVFHGEKIPYQLVSDNMEDNTHMMILMSHFICLRLFINICFTTNFQFLIHKVLRKLMKKILLELKCFLQLDKII